MFWTFKNRNPYIALLSVRMMIYWKTKGHCYICGKFVDFDMFEIELKVQFAKGVTNDFKNLWCSCHTCNALKGSISSADIMEKIKQINLYQVKKYIRIILNGKYFIKY